MNHEDTKNAKVHEEKRGLPGKQQKRTTTRASLLADTVSMSRGDLATSSERKLGGSAGTKARFSRVSSG
jgi:hypothetical protein